MTDKVQKIRDGVERLRNLHQMKYQQYDTNDNMCLVECGKRNLCNELLSFIDSLQEEPVSLTNKVVQVRRCLEEVATTINPFIDEVIKQFNLKDKSIVAKEIQYRGIGLKGDFGENIHRSDDEVIYILKEDKTVGLIVIRRTEFNNAEITMVKTEERFKEKAMTKQETIQVLQSIEDRAIDFPEMTECDWVAIAAAKRYLTKEPVSEDLEKASIIHSEIVRNASFIDEDFIAGAKWQKEQIMKDAVDAKIGSRIEGVIYDVDFNIDSDLEPDDKIKVIIIKNE